MAVLQQRTNGGSRRLHTLAHGTTRIGRQNDCELFLNSQDVSRFHARILYEDEQFLIEDLGSRNGTQLNGQTIDQRVVLRNGDRLRFSSLEFTYFSERPLNDDSSVSHQPPSVITLQTGSLSASDAAPPLAVREGDRISPDLIGRHELPSSAIISRISAGQADGDWPTLRDASAKLHSVLSMQHRLRVCRSIDETIEAIAIILLTDFSFAANVTIVLRHFDDIGFVVGVSRSRDPETEAFVCLPAIVASMESADVIHCMERTDLADETPIDGQKAIIRHVLCAPLLDSSNGPFGAVQIDTQASGDIRPTHMEMLAIMSHVAAYGIEQAGAAEQRITRLLLNRSVETADCLRRNLEPTRLPRVNGFLIRHQVLTVPDVAADLVDYVRLPDGRQACFILDVPGRGQAAAALMAGISNVVTRALVASGSAAEAVRRAEDDLQSRMALVPMITSICIAILDRERSAVTISVAGHCPAYLIRAETVNQLSDSAMTGPPLGALRDAYEEFEVCLGDDDILLLCSDGIARIPYPNGELVTHEGVHDLMTQCAQAGHDGLADRLMTSINTIRGHAPLQDDVALLTIHRTDVAPADSSAFRLPQRQATE